MVLHYVHVEEWMARKRPIFGGGFYRALKRTIWLYIQTRATECVRGSNEMPGVALRRVLADAESVWGGCWGSRLR